MSGEGERFGSVLRTGALVSLFWLLPLGPIGCNEPRPAPNTPSEVEEVEDDTDVVDVASVSDTGAADADVAVACGGRCGPDEVCESDVCLPACAGPEECDWNEVCEGWCQPIVCATGGDCPEEVSPCAPVACEEGRCLVLPYIGPLPDNAAGDCWVPYCHIEGVEPAPDDTDTPPDDGIACTVEACEFGVAMHVADDSLCEDGDPLSVHECDPVAGCVDITPPWVCGSELGDGWDELETCGDGQDNDGNGEVDEGCSCDFGSVQPCFTGAPAARGVGACMDGQQVCVDWEEPRWSECVGVVEPSPEECNARDDDCDGCLDDMADCSPVVACPSEQYARPGEWHTLRALDFSIRDEAWEWFEWTISARPPTSTHAFIENRGGAETRAWFDVVGDYEITLEFLAVLGWYRCTWVVHVGGGGGLRVEMTWDTPRTDLDLHLHRSGSTTDFCTDDDCYYANCQSATANPRLVVDIIHELPPERIIHSYPEDGETFRIMVHMFAGAESAIPVVTIQCGGVIRATLGRAPNEAVLSRSGSACQGHTWRVADVTMHIDAETGVTDCIVDVLRGEDGGWDIRLDDASY